MNARQKMTQLVERMNAHGFKGHDIDARPDCESDWTKDYAIAQFDVTEPDDSEYFDFDRYKRDLENWIIGYFTTSHAKTYVLHGHKGERKPVTGDRVLYLRSGAGRWQVEAEFYIQAKR